MINNLPKEPPIAYMERTKNYYLGLGYENPYRWSHFNDVPFSSLTAPLSDARIAIVTSAAPFQPNKGDQGPGAAYNAAVKFFRVYKLPTEPEPDLRISHVAIDRMHTTGEDKGTYFPLTALKKARDSQIIKEISPFIYGFPTNRSQRTNMERDCLELVSQLQDDEIDAVIAVPNCPVCHQSIALAARAAESAGMPTVIMGCALDIIEYVGVPRFYFSDFPLGNSCGRPHDPTSQWLSITGALDLLTTAQEPRTTVTSPMTWNGSPNWKQDYSNIERLNATEIESRRAAFDEAKRIAAGKRETDAE